MNKLLNRQYLAVEGLDNALDIAKHLIKNGYQVMVQDDSVNIYIVAFAPEDENLGASRFALLTQDEIENIEYERDQADYAAAKEKYEEGLVQGIYNEPAEINPDKEDK